MDELPVITPPSIFVDGTNELHDDGAHGDGRAGDGRYANTFVKTTKEGTYTFRFRISGQTPGGGRFADTITVSRWVGVDVSPSLSSVTFRSGLQAPEGLRAARVIVTPRDRNGEYLGPFRSSEIQFSATGGTFSGPMLGLPDGRYARDLIYRPNAVPRVTVSVQGKRFLPVVVAPGCLGQLTEPLRSLLERLRALLPRMG
jgi:hypothetical protein